ncbi:MAG: SDR family oxidoreductase [Bacteroidales bacterium]|nr:SDR family oxidoreductase [Bacteroidales bacterium]MCF8328617.1 SDR family oxidoreductase [Bacteroidales bacterium]
MDLQITKHQFLVTGASDGFGRQVAEVLASEGARVVAVARNEEKLKELSDRFPGLIETIPGDLFDDEFLNELIAKCQDKHLQGVFVNAGGPPPMGFQESEITDWDKAYKTVVRWKIKLVKGLLPVFKSNDYGRILFLESASLRQPVADLVLSNSLRLAIAGAAKTLSLEVADEGITVNILAPGFHETNAVKRIINKKSETQNISKQKAKEQITSGIPVGFAGNPANLASLATWLLSPLSEFVTGQTYVIDGGNSRSTSI